MLLQAVKNLLEEKRPLVEHSLETGRMYLREEGLEDKRLSADSGEGRFSTLIHGSLWIVTVLRPQ